MTRGRPVLSPSGTSAGGGRRGE